MEYDFGEIKVAVSNADRVVFTDSEITKGDVVAYYRDCRVAEALGSFEPPDALGRFAFRKRLRQYRPATPCAHEHGRAT